MSYHHFTIEERVCLREYYVKGYIVDKKACKVNLTEISSMLCPFVTFNHNIAATLLFCIL